MASLLLRKLFDCRNMDTFYPISFLLPTFDAEINGPSFIVIPERNHRIKL